MVKPIKKLSDLIELLQASTKEQYAKIGASIDLSAEEFTKYEHYSKKHYTRNCIHREEHFELILLCWEEGQKTPVHCHGGEECWVHILKGNLRETHFQYISGMLIRESKEVIRQGEKSFMNDELGYHSLKNIGPKRAMSLHLYMNPIDECTVFKKKTNSFEPIALSYHSIDGVLEKEYTHL